MLDKIEITKRIAALSPEKRASFEKLLRQEGVDIERLPIFPRARAIGALPLSFAQQRLWFLDQLEPGIPYHIPQTVRLQGRLDWAALQKCLNEIVRRHEVLRTTFAMADGQPIQIVAPDMTVQLTIVDLRSLPEKTREAEVQRLAALEARRPFDLQKGPLFRATLLQLSETEHVFLPTMHHIAFDGWSLDIFIRELKTLYEAFVAGKPSPLHELPIQYADFALWQRQWLQEDVLASRLSYWKQELAGAPPVLDLPTDHARPAAQTFNGAHQSFVLPANLAKALQALSQKEGATLFMTLLAAFKILLYRYTGQNDIVVGTPVANRQRPELEDLIGFFVNMLALRTDLSKNPNFRQLLAQVRQTALGAYDHQELPFEKLVDELQLQRDLSRPPLFQVLFVWQNTSRSAFELPGLILNRMDINYPTAWFDWSLYMWEEDGHLAGALEYNTDLFEADTIARTLEHFRTLLEGIAANSNRRLSDLPLLPEVERRQLFNNWNETETAYPREKCFHDLFEAQVERTPEAVAVVFENEQLTYRELNQRANQMARYLSRCCGVKPETMVGICVERSPAMIVSLLGIMKAGAAYVPLDPAFPLERLRFMLEDSQAPVLLTTKSTIENFQLNFENLKLVYLDSDWPAIAQENLENSPSVVTLNHLAYVIYTSGSTGKPKGVAITQRSLVNFLGAMREQPGMTASDILLSVTTLSFDIAALEIYLPLMTGGRLVLVHHETTKDGAQLSAQLAEADATIMQATPATWRLLLESGWLGCSYLKILCGGEALPGDLAEKLLAKSAALWNMYGPTETTIWSGVYRVTSAKGTVPIGQPIANTQFYILDAHLNATPIGVPGELHIGGDGLARGYMNRPELRAEKFIPDPYGNTQGSRLYKTGDRARYLPNGCIEFLGRLDHQVKLRGFRIELAEIEAVLREHPQVRTGAVIVREDIPGVKRLVAYVVPAPAFNTHEIIMPELRLHLAAKLPDYMVPQVFVFLEILPLTPNGKLDRRALPAPEASRSETNGAYVGPRTSLEQTLATIWANCIGVEKISIHDNFFAIGGDSILSMKIIARAGQAGLRLTPKQIFSHQTIAELAAAIEINGTMKTEPSVTAEPALLKFNQQQLDRLIKKKLAR